MGVATEANVTVEKAMDQHGKQNTKKNHIGVVGVAKIVFLPCSLNSYVKSICDPHLHNVKKLLQKIGTKKKKLLQISL